jgi:hypothetical protein
MRFSAAFVSLSFSPFSIFSESPYHVYLLSPQRYVVCYPLPLRSRFRDHHHLPNFQGRMVFQGPARTSFLSSFLTAHRPLSLTRILSFVPFRLSLHRSSSSTPSRPTLRPLPSCLSRTPPLLDPSPTPTLTFSPSRSRPRLARPRLPFLRKLFSFRLVSSPTLSPSPLEPPCMLIIASVSQYRPIRCPLPDQRRQRLLWRRPH